MRGPLRALAAVVLAAGLAACAPAMRLAAYDQPRACHGHNPSCPTPTPMPTTTTTSPGACVTSADNGSCGPYLYPGIAGSSGSNTYVVNNVWNPVAGASQTLTAYDPGNWSVVADVPAGNAAVVSYPCTQQLYGSLPLSGFTAITSSFAEAMNPAAGTMAEAAYDLWLNNWASEVMIWNDNQGQSLAYDTYLGAVTIGGQAFSIYRNGAPGGELIVSLNASEQSGTVDILATLGYLGAQGWLPAASTLTAVDYGFEVSSTGGALETFTVLSYGITAS